MLAGRSVSSHPPSVELLSPKGGEEIEQGKNLTVKWEGSDPDDQELTYTLALSLDGQTWIPWALDIEENQYELNTTTFSPGNYYLKIIATDGVLVGEDMTEEPFRKERTTEIHSAASRRNQTNFGLRIADCGIKIFNPKSEIRNPQSKIVTFSWTTQMLQGNIITLLLSPT